MMLELDTTKKSSLSFKEWYGDLLTVQKEGDDLITVENCILRYDATVGMITGFRVEGEFDINDVSSFSNLVKDFLRRVDAGEKNIGEDEDGDECEYDLSWNYYAVWITYDGITQRASSFTFKDWNDNFRKGKYSFYVGLPNGDRNIIFPETQEHRAFKQNSIPLADLYYLDEHLIKLFNDE